MGRNNISIRTYFVSEPGEDVSINYYFQILVVGKE